MNTRHYECIKCGSNQHQIEEISTTGNIWSRIFDIQGKQFTAVVCSRCKHTEFYRISIKQFQKVSDSLMSRKSD